MTAIKGILMVLIPVVERSGSYQRNSDSSYSVGGAYDNTRSPDGA
jgi:hypothetical protein